MSSPEHTRPQYIGTSYVRHSDSSIVFSFTFNNALFSVVAASPDDEAGGALVPTDYNFDDSIEGKILDEILDLSVHDGDGPWNTAKQEATRRLKKQLADLAADACLPTMRRLAPTQIPAAQTLQDNLYPPTYTLQVLTEGDKLTCCTLDDYTGIPERHPPVPEERLRAMELDLDTTDLLVVKPSQVILVRHLHHLVWRVMVDGEEMICKASLDLFEHAVSDELATYLKIRTAGVKLRVPDLKGVIQSHRGVIGILLAYILHKHHSLHAVLAGVKEGTVAPSEATPSLRQKWARQIRETLAGLHSLRILWRDLKTHNVLIDNNSDAVVLDFGGGNTVGWVDNDKYATMEGEEQGLRKIMEALGVQA
ncbi:hypothetical protein C8A00DRAFT_16297 [Chaetomidium leptoderma]|uniref:Protein kinase domain-containing protein n=1 Tax=Chaetomidium leptoderma TaxID=669021 RepID=A0AAN6VKA6_9PEZI|nr:hypothetical protein C8A00DRAFT_16297 [Chaetomidium leptoderma]